MKKFPLLLSCLLLTQATLIHGADSVKVWEEPLVLPTYRVEVPEVVPMFFRNQSYQGASRYVYPYALQDNITNEKSDQVYKALYLENEYIKLCVLPEIGGRLFYATDKTNGYEIFYRQHVIKPANIGMAGAWISGGIEFCVFHHHRASTNIPVEYRLVENADGSATIWLGETEPRHRMKWSLGITLYPGNSAIEVDGRLINPTENVNSILYWANVATHVNDDYQIIFPPSTEFGVYHAKNSFLHWPITKEVYHGHEHYKSGLDASWWKNHPTPISIFAHEIKDGFLAGYDHGKQAGTMHVGNPHIVKGAKLWEWGAGSIWDSVVLTDNDGPYAELMTGAYSDNQPDYSWLKPHELKTFKQYWYPIRNTEGASAANLSGTLTLKRVNDRQVRIAVNSTERLERASVILEDDGQPVFNKTLTIAPDKPFVERVAVNPNTDTAHLKLILKDDAGEELIAYKPITVDSDAPLPDPVTPPKAPEDIETIEELYLTGLRIRQFHNARLKYEDYFLEALRRDPFDTRCNTQMGIKLKEEGRLEEAAAHFRKAISRLTANYTRPRNCEAQYHLGLILKSQGALDEAYDTLYRAAWDQAFASAAYTYLAQISTIRGDYTQALEEVQRSLDYNATNLSALNLQATLLRKTNQTAAALAVTEAVLERDPLSPWAYHEQALLGMAEQMASLKTQLGDNPESWLELAIGYLNAGFNAEAKDILLLAKGFGKIDGSAYPTTHYYLGYLYHLEGDVDAARRHFSLGKALPTDYCFPFRLESLEVYQTALAMDPTDSRAHYYTGNLLFDKQPHEAIAAWEKAVELEPELAIAHRNLGWGYNHAEGNLDKAIAAYENAIQQDPSQAKYFYELDTLYEHNGTNIAVRHKLLTDHHDHVAKRSDSLLREIRLLTANGEPETAIAYLLENFFPRQEGVDNLHDTYADACLMAGIKELNTDNLEAAMAYFKQAQEYPENHQMRRKRGDSKEAQMLYFQSIAAKEMKDFQEHARLLEAIKAMKIRQTEYKIYQAMACLDSDDPEAAVPLIREIEAEGQFLLSDAADVDFFSKFGEDRPDRLRHADGHFLLAMANLLRGDPDAAQRLLEKATQLDPGHLWAGYYLK